MIIVYILCETFIASSCSLFYIILLNKTVFRKSNESCGNLRILFLVVEEGNILSWHCTKTINCLTSRICFVPHQLIPPHDVAKKLNMVLYTKLQTCLPNFYYD